MNIKRSNESEECGSLVMWTVYSDADGKRALTNKLKAFEGQSSFIELCNCSSFLIGPFIIDLALHKSSPKDGKTVYYY